MRLLEEHKATSEKERNLLKLCRDAVQRVDASAQVILYGSRARGDAAEESDYDLLVITEGDVNLAREDFIRQQLYPIELDTGAVLTLLLVGRRDWESPEYRAMPFSENVRREGISL